jgi:hypothetical protein
VIGTKNVTRVEIACPGGVTYLWDARYSPFHEKPGNVSVALADDGQTLRVFIDTQDARRVQSYPPPAKQD